MKETLKWTPQDIFARIDALCKKKEWTLNTLCSEAQITPSTLYTIRNRKSFPSIETLNAICDALGISLSTFFEIEEHQTFYSIYKRLNPTCQHLLEELAKHLH